VVACSIFYEVLDFKIGKFRMRGSHLLIVYLSQRLEIDGLALMQVRLGTSWIEIAIKQLAILKHYLLYLNLLFTWLKVVLVFAEIVIFIYWSKN